MFPEFGFLLAVYSGVFLLTSTLPGTDMPGYVVDESGSPLWYRVNGLRTLLCILAIAHGFFEANLFSPTFLVDNIWNIVIAANLLGLLAATAFYGYATSVVDPKKLPRTRCAATTSHSASGKRSRSYFSDVFFGLQFNPRPLHFIDWKLTLYTCGAVMLVLMLISQASAHLAARADGHLSLAMSVYLLLSMCFVLDYLFHEHVHLFTYDFFAERIGFQLAWGCLVFFPFFYSIAAWPLVQRPMADVPPVVAIVCGGVYVLGWLLSRGANNQKYFFKIQPQASTCFLGLVQQRTISSAPILCSGFWGLARHINYLGEILMASALAALPVLAVRDLEVVWPALLYPLYYLVLLVSRQIDDDKICAAKYGGSWEAYKRQVPSRIIPYIY